MILEFVTEIGQPPKVRQAIAMLFDRDKLRQLNPVFAPNYQLITNKLIGGATIKPYKWSSLARAEQIAQANKLLDQAKINPDYPVVLYLPDSVLSYSFLAPVFEQMAKDSRGRIQFRKAENDAQVNVIFKELEATYNHVSSILRHCQCLATQNRGYLCNFSFDNLYSQAMVTTNQDAQNMIFAAAVNVLQEDYKLIPLASFKPYYLKRPDLAGLAGDSISIYYQDFYFLEK